MRSPISRMRSLPKASRFARARSDPQRSRIALSPLRAFWDAIQGIGNEVDALFEIEAEQIFPAQTNTGKGLLCLS